MARRFNDAIGWLLLRLAAVLHRTVASEDSNARWIARRNSAVRAAYRRGMPVPEMAARLGLSQGWVRQVLAGKRPPAVEEAA